MQSLTIRKPTKATKYVTVLYCGCMDIPLPPSTPPPPMTPPPTDVVYIYPLKNRIEKKTAELLWSFFSESHGIYLPEKEPYTTIVCTKRLDLPALEKKMVEMSALYDLYCFDSVKILPGYTALLHVE